MEATSWDSTVLAFSRCPVPDEDIVSVLLSLLASPLGFRLRPGVAQMGLQADRLPGRGEDAVVGGTGNTGVVAGVILRSVVVLQFMSWDVPKPPTTSSAVSLSTADLLLGVFSSGEAWTLSDEPISS